MLERVLSHFPAYTYPLTLVSDPDQLLAEESLLTTLAERGFSLLAETDPVRLRHAVAQRQPFNLNHPLLIITTNDLRHLPYDLWQQGHHVNLALHHFFPHLAYPVLRQLSPEQRWRLSQAPPPRRRLGQQASKVYLLRHVFAAHLDSLTTPAQLIAWLNQHHQQLDSLPPPLTDYVLAALTPQLHYTDWPLADLLADKDTFRAWVTTQWQAFVQAETGEQLLGETAVSYHLPFAGDEALQDAVPSLVRSGALAPVPLTESTQLPVWAKTAVLAPNEDSHLKQAVTLLARLAEQAQELATARWSQWQAIALTWAELTNWHNQPHRPLTAEQQAAYQSWAAQLDAAFATWLGHHYAPLGVKRLPIPHHLHHVLSYLAANRRSRLALIVLDGLSLADWLLIQARWQARQPEWQIHQQLLLAQIPTITAVSRQALISGLRPAEFAVTLAHNRAEARHWIDFWLRQGLAAQGCVAGRLSLHQPELPAALSSSRLQALCLINNSIDDMLHGASLGAADVQASLRLWLDERLPALEAVIHNLRQRQFQVYLTSDHGHVAAVGMGKPAEGVLVETRSKRARLYRQRETAVQVQQAFPDTILWESQGLLPADAWVLLPTGRQAFAPQHEVVVTHGGLTLDEVIVPLVEIK